MDVSILEASHCIFFEINGGKLSVSPRVRFFPMWRTRISTVLLLCLSKEQRFFSSKQVDYSAETAIFFFMEK